MPLLRILVWLHGTYHRGELRLGQDGRWYHVVARAAASVEFAGGILDVMLWRRGFALRNREFFIVSAC